MSQLSVSKKRQTYNDVTLKKVDGARGSARWLVGKVGWQLESFIAPSLCTDTKHKVVRKCALRGYSERFNAFLMNKGTRQCG